MARFDGLIPARFLSIMSHMTIVLTILMAREDTVRSCLPFEYTDQQFYAKDQEMLVGLSLAVALMAVELGGFLLGVSMFRPTAAMTSTLCHSSACICLSYFLADGWDCRFYWIIFSLCSLLPAAIELLIIVTAVGFKRDW